MNLIIQFIVNKNYENISLKKAINITNNNTIGKSGIINFLNFEKNYIKEY